MLGFFIQSNLDFSIKHLTKILKLLGRYCCLELNYEDILRVIFLYCYEGLKTFNLTILG